jgi:quinol monooxygenase YgiN
MSATVIFEADVKAGKMDLLLNLLSEYLPETRKYRGFIDVSIHVEKNKNQILLYQKWDRFEDYESYLQWRTDTGVMKILGETLNSPPSIRYFKTLEVVGGLYEFL